ncbi:MAG TPA: polysaccharide pyruvyl transferase family protein [Steroidobacteraceae bacterium]|nr:polysaccharide pyruvyl transferase family protein [Steroidobacteraceae bacterium]
MLIEVEGVQFENKGAELMLLAVLERLRREWPRLEFALAPNPNTPFRRIVAAGGWQRLRADGAPVDMDAWSYRLPARLLERLHRHGIVTEREIDAVLDASGFAYGATWDDSAMESTAREVRRLARHRKPYLFLPQAFGPFRITGTARAFGRALLEAALLCAREPESKRHLAELHDGLEQRIEVFPDFTMQLAGDVAAARRHDVDRGTALLVPNQMMRSEFNPDPQWRAGYDSLMQSIGRQLAQDGWRVRVLNHEGHSDEATCRLLAESLSAGPVIAEPDPLALKGTLGAAGLVVCSRYHGCVSALAQGVPCLGTAWSHKYAALFEDFAASEFLLQQCDERQASQALSRLLEQRGTLPRQLASRLEVLAARNEQMWQRVIGILRQAGGA